MDSYSVGLTRIDDAKAELTELSIKIAANPELAWEEIKAHDWLSDYLEQQGFQVTR